MNYTAPKIIALGISGLSCAKVGLTLLVSKYHWKCHVKSEP